ncbi:MAG: ParA family protein [Candidatus Sericytochromatia bacterium]|nr:ParA family protein [Candidatus Sericytochromatia bacterium]
MIIAIANQKGGVAKTTTTLNLGAALHEAGYKVLLVDMDPQANLTLGLGINPEGLPASLYHVLVGERRADEILRTTPEGDLLPSSIELAGAEIELINELGREATLKDKLAPLVGRYDFVLIDTPPSLGLLTINSLNAAGGVLIPMQCQFLSAKGVQLLLTTVDKVRTKLNPGLRLLGLLPTMFDRRLLLAKEVLSEMQERFGELVFETIIGNSVRAAESPIAGQSLITYQPNSPLSDSYRQLAVEVRARVGAEPALQATR